MKEFYASPDGKDYILQLDNDAKFITCTNIETRIKVVYPFDKHSEALSQFKVWMDNSDIRIPKTFFIETKHDTPLHALREELAKHDLTLPQAEKLSRYIVYHGHQSMILDGDFDNKFIPEMNLVSLRKISRSRRRVTMSMSPNITTGLFAR